MYKTRLLSTLLIMCLVLIPFTATGVYASWVYLSDPSPIDETINSKLGSFVYGDIYITKVKKVGTSSGDVNSTLEKTNTTTVAGNINLGKSQSSTATFEITFYNGSDTVYYYNEAETITSTNDNIIYQVSGIAQKDAVDPKTYKTITVTYSYDNANNANTVLESGIHFKFVIDKDSIGIVVARTAVDRFRDILNNIAAPNSYETLDTAMDNRAGWNAASDVTYIGNVTGSSSADSQVIVALFGQEFMSMDLDGDGNVEPITMMIKRENLDNDTSTGATYTYTYRNRQYSVEGVEMTIYITSENLDNVRMGTEVVVYAASFTIYPGDSEWVDLVPLTKGTASANNYTSGSWGTANSFNTDTWQSDDGKTMDELAKEAVNN